MSSVQVAKYIKEEERMTVDLAQKAYKSSIFATEKITSNFDWALQDWTVLYDCYYCNGVSSPKFLLNGTDITWKLFLKPYPTVGSKGTAILRIHFSREPTFLTMIFTVSFYNGPNNKPMKITKTFLDSCLKSEELPLPAALCKDCSHVENNVLLLSVQFTIVKSVSISAFPATLHDTVEGDFRKNLKSIFDSKSFSDITFHIGDEKLFAHKVILAAKSDVFNAMFLSGMKEETESVIEIIDTEAKVFKEFLHYIYVGKITGLETMVDKMILLADKYQVEDLKSLCGSHMSAYLDTENVVKYLLIAYKLNCDTLKNKALELIKLNTHILTNEADYKLLGEYPPLIQEIFGKSPPN